MSKALMSTPGVTEHVAAGTGEGGVEAGVPVITNVFPDWERDVLPKLTVSDSDPSMVPVALIVVVTVEVTVARCRRTLSMAR